MSEKNHNTGKKNITKDILIGVFSFLAPMILMALIWGAREITYGGKVTPLIFDMKGQYMPFLASLRYIAEGENSLLFSWNVSLGGNYLSLLAYYMASPLSWITVFFDLAHMPDAIYVLTLLKIGLCGLSFSLFLRFGIAKKSLWTNIIFACCYALMSYNIMYGMCLMWLDGVIFLPIILLGIEKLLEGKKGFLYFVSMAGLLVCNYYTAYMVGIFAAAYILYRAGSMVSKENLKSMFKVLVRFAVNTVLALGVAMPFLLSILYNLMMGKGGGALIMPPGSYQFTIGELLSKFLPVQYDSIDNSGLPSIYCGSLMLMLALLYFVQKRGIREKVLTLGMLMVPFSGFLMKEIDLAWHGFLYPTCFPYRYAFLFSAMLLLVAYRAFLQIPKSTSFSKTLIGMGAVFLCTELFFNGAVIVGGLNKECGYSVRMQYDVFMDFYPDLAQKIKEDDGFFRMDADRPYYSQNDEMLFNLKGASYFSSTFNDNVNTFLRLMGGADYYIITTGNGMTPWMDSLLGIKYRIGTTDLPDSYQKIDEKKMGGGKINLYRNPDSLSLGYMVNEAGLNKERSLLLDPFYNQNQLVSALGFGDRDLLHEIAFEKKEEKEDETLFEFVALSDNPVYLYIDAYISGTETINEAGKAEGSNAVLSVSVNGRVQESTVPRYSKKAYYLGQFAEGERVSVAVKTEGKWEKVSAECLYEMDMTTYSSVIAGLKERQLENISTSGNKLEGDVTAGEGQILFTTIPFERGFTVKVDGVKSPYGVAMNTFLVIPLEEGRHHIEISYVPWGFYQGIIAAVGALAVALIYFRRDCFKKALKKTCNIM